MTMSVHDLHGADRRTYEDLLQKNTVAPYELQKAQALYNALAKKIEESEKHLMGAEEQLKEAQRRRDTFDTQTPQRPVVDVALDAIRKEAAVQEKLIEELDVQRRGLIMTAPIDGIVVQIPTRTNDAGLRRPGEGVMRKGGEVVMAGEPILVIAQVRPKEIIAYAMTGQIDQVKVGQRVELVKKSVPAKMAQSQIISVSPIVEQLPPRLWINPNMPQWGLPFIIGVPEELELTSGEMVNIRGL